jgi:uncharacterized membrane protein YbhN (UPF0104 family)
MVLATVAVVGLIFSIRAFPLRDHWLGLQFAVLLSDLRNSLSSGRAIGIAIASNLFGVLLIYILGLAIGAGLRAFDCLILVPPVLLVSALPISLGGWGVREGVLVGAFSMVQADPASVAAISVLFGLTTPLVGGSVVVASLFTGWRNIPTLASYDDG